MSGEKTSQVEIPIEELNREKSEEESAQQEPKEKAELTIEDKIKRLKKIVGLIDENKVSVWLEGRNDSNEGSVDTEDAETLHQFFPEDGVHPMWKEILKGDLESVTGWIATTKERGEDIDKADKANRLNALHYAILFNKEDILTALLESGASGKWDRIKPQELLTPFRKTLKQKIPPSCCTTTIGKLIDDLFWDDALRTAVKEDRLEDVQLLIQHGANPLHCQRDDITDLVDDEYLGGITTLEIAILRRDKPMVMAMLNKGGPKEGGRGGARGRAWEIDTEKLKDVKDCTSTETSHRHTPFANLVDNIPDVAAMVLDHCITTKGAPYDKDYKISFDCSLLENKTSNANKFYRGLPGAWICDLIRYYSISTG